MKARLRNTKRILLVGVSAALLATGFARGQDEVTSTVDGLYEQAVAAYDHKEHKTALKLFRKMQKDFPMSGYAVRGWEYIAQCENKLGDSYAAFEAYQNIWEDHKDFSKLSVITRNQMQIGNHFLTLKRYKYAIEVYQKVLENAPYSEVAAAAQYSLAQALIGRKEYEAAKTELRKVIKNYPTSQLVDDAAFDLGYINYLQSAEMNYDQTATTEAIASFRRFIHNFPSSTKVYEARKYITKLRDRKAASLFRMGEFYDNIRAPKAAEIAFREVIEQYPDTDCADRARARIGMLKHARLAKADMARQETAMLALRDGKSLAKSRDIAERELAKKTPAAPAEEPTPQVAEEGVSEPGTRAASVDVTPKRRARDRSETVTRLKELYGNPATRAELRAAMKDVYLKEFKQAKETRAAWQRQKLIALAEAREDAAKLLGDKPAPKQFREEEAERIEITAVTEPRAPDGKPATSRPTGKEKAAPTAAREVGPSVTDVPVVPAADLALSEEQADEPPPYFIGSAELDEIISVDKTPAVEAPEAAPEEVTGAPEETEAAPDELTPVYEEIERAGEEEPAEEDGVEFAVVDMPTRRDESETPAEEVEAGEEPETPVGVAEEDAVLDEAGMPAPGTEQARLIAEAQIHEQRRAARAKQAIEAARQRRAEQGWQARKMTGPGRVRRAKYSEEEEEKRRAVLDTDAMQREYAAVYYLIQRGDVARQQGLQADAKKYYGEALDGLVDIKRKAPTWESDIVNFRIDYCRKQMRSVE